MTRRQDDHFAIEHLGDARQLMWGVAKALIAKGPVWDEAVEDLEAADRWLAQATTDLTHRRVKTRKGDYPMDRLRLDTTAIKSLEVLSSPRAEVIAELWQAVSYVEEVRGRLSKSVRATDTSREMAELAIREAMTQLILAASLLIPAGLAQATQQLVVSQA